MHGKAQRETAQRAISPVLTKLFPFVFSFFFVFSFSLFSVSVPCARLSWPSRQL